MSHYLCIHALMSVWTLAWLAADLCLHVGFLAGTVRCTARCIHVTCHHGGRLQGSMCAEFTAETMAHAAWALSWLHEQEHCSNECMLSRGCTEEYA